MLKIGFDKCTLFWFTSVLRASVCEEGWNFESAVLSVEFGNIYFVDRIENVI